MPRYADYVAVAQRLEESLEHKAFMTISRKEVTNILREVSGEPRTRIKTLIAHDLTEALGEHGLSFYPTLGDTDTRDNVRLFRTASVIGNIVNIIVHPTPETDAELGAALKKIKGQWNWHHAEEPVFQKAS